MNHPGISQILRRAFMGLFFLCSCTVHQAGMYATGPETGLPLQGADGSVMETGTTRQEQEGMSFRKICSCIAPLVVMPYTVVPLAITVGSGLGFAGDMASRTFRGTPEVPKEQQKQVELVSVDRASE